MVFGPVFHFELITTGRRGRFYVARIGYGLLLLIALSGEYQRWAADRPLVTIQSMARFAEQAFMAFAWAQGAAILALVPALVAGVIADEHQRKTLHELLGSRLSSAGIVLGKLAARLAHAGMILLMGLPVVSLVGLFGGLDPWDVFFVYAGTLAVALFVAGLSMLVSVVARRPRDAILIAYGLEALWLLVPLAFEPIAMNFGPPLEWIKPVNDALLVTNPYQVWRMSDQIHEVTFRAVERGIIASRSAAANGWSLELWVRFLWMSGVLTGLGTLFLALAVALLRPLHGGSWRRPRRRAPGAPRLALPAPARPECGDDPMLWKECYAAGGGLTWMRSRPVVLVLGVLLGCYLYDAGGPAFAELLGSSARSGSAARLTLNSALRESGTFLFVLTLLSVASASAVSVTSERERDTWTSLTASLLTGREIVVGKIRGAVACSRHLIRALLVMGAVGLLSGAVHPLGALAALAGLAVFTRFAAALGAYVSLRARNSTRALFATVACLAVLNGGYLVLLGPLLGRSSLGYSGVMPFVEWLSLFSYRDVRSFWANGVFVVDGYRTGYDVSALVAYAVALTGYGLGAMVLTGAAVEAFDKVVDRPAARKIHHKGTKAQRRGSKRFTTEHTERKTKEVSFK
jgi:ABC-type transport system involved in multi-copper enzyme maturation permease subunit